MNIRSEIGFCASVLYHKAWGKTLVGNRLRSETWWKNKLEELINAPTIVLPPQELSLESYDVPIPFEQEMGWTEETAPYWLGWFQTIFQRRYEQQAKSQAMA
jgi:hypothetical protein